MPTLSPSSPAGSRSAGDGGSRCGCATCSWPASATPTPPFDPAAHPDRVNLGCGLRQAPRLPQRRPATIPRRPTWWATSARCRRCPPAATRRSSRRTCSSTSSAPTARSRSREWRRLAAPGASLRLRVPDLPSILRWLRRATTTPGHHRSVIHHMFGTQAYDGDFHLSGYTELLLCDELFRAGFGDVEMELRDGWLWEVEGAPRRADPAARPLCGAPASIAAGGADGPPLGRGRPPSCACAWASRCRTEVAISASCSGDIRTVADQPCRSRARGVDRADRAQRGAGRARCCASPRAPARRA